MKEEVENENPIIWYQREKAKGKTPLFSPSLTHSESCLYWHTRKWIWDDTITRRDDDERAQGTSRPHPGTRSWSFPFTIGRRLNIFWLLDKYQITHRHTPPKKENVCSVSLLECRWNKLNICLTFFSPIIHRWFDFKILAGSFLDRYQINSKKRKKPSAVRQPDWAKWPLLCVCLSAKFVFFYTWTHTLDEMGWPQSFATQPESIWRRMSVNFPPVSICRGRTRSYKTSGRINKKKILFFLFDEHLLLFSSSGTRIKKEEKPQHFVGLWFFSLGLSFRAGI